jgi:hypothetical protein
MSNEHKPMEQVYLTRFLEEIKAQQEEQTRLLQKVHSTMNFIAVIVSIVSVIVLFYSCLALFYVVPQISF